MEKYVSHMRKENRYVSFCTREGLLDFARTGILPEYSEQIVPVASPKARVLILKEMLYHPNPSKPIYLLDDSRVQASSEFIFFVAPKERIILQRRQMKGVCIPGEQPDRRLYRLLRQSGAQRSDPAHTGSE